MTTSPRITYAAVDLLTEDFDFDLPPERIAQQPLPQRDASRLLVLDRRHGTLHHSRIAHLGEWLAAGDLLVANNSRVFPARLRGTREPSGGAVELLLLRPENGAWRALAKPAKRLKVGMNLEIRSRYAAEKIAHARLVQSLGSGEVLVRFEDGADRRLEEFGEVPLPPYIGSALDDAERYQTVYGQTVGSAAAPTAGLHFSEALITRLREMGIGWEEITLHIGLDTFRPVTEERVADHVIHSEWCHVSDATARSIADTRAGGRRVVAIGTTTARTLETMGESWNDANPSGFTGYTDTFIVPGHEWRLVDGLLTNFHLPKSTLLMLVSALAGRNRVLEAYAEAIERGYRFYSFGDAMLIL